MLILLPCTLWKPIPVQGSMPKTCDRCVDSSQCLDGMICVVPDRTRFDGCCMKIK